MQSVYYAQTLQQQKVTDKGGNQMSNMRNGYPGESNSQTCVQGSVKLGFEANSETLLEDMEAIPYDCQ